MTVHQLSDLAQNDDRLDPRTRLLLLVVSTAAFLAVIDGTLVSVALGSLASTFDRPLTTVIWVTVSYLLAAAAVLPLLTWLTARLGARRVFLIGLATFAAGSVLTGLAGSVEQLIGFRVLQGLGGGLLEPASLTLAAQLAPRRRVGAVLGTLSMVINIAPVVGPALGALLLARAGWPWLFWFKVPIAIALFAVTVIALVGVDGSADHGADRTAPQRVDLAGVGLLTGGVLGLLFALNRIGTSSPAAVILGSAALGLLALTIFVRRGLTGRIGAGRQPAFDLALLRRGSFVASLIIMSIVGWTMYSQLTMLPILATTRFGLTGIGTGLLVVALGVGLLIAMPTSSRLSDRTGPRRLVGLGSAGLMIMLAGFSLLLPVLTLPLAMGWLVMIGVCLGFVAAPSFSSVYRVLPAELVAQGTTGLFLAVQFSASVGVVLIGLLENTVGRRAPSAIEAVLAVAALGVLITSRRLPGTPEGAIG